MTAYYVRSGAAGSANGTSWANAYTTMATALSGKAAGDIFYVAEDHAESSASSLTLTSPGTNTNPCYLYCVDHAGSVPPVSADLRTTASIATTGNSGITFGGSWVINGLIATAGNSTGNPSLAIGATTASVIRARNCSFAFGGTGGTLSIGGAGVPTPGYVDCENTTFGFGSGTSSSLTVNGMFRWRNTTSAIVGSGVPANLFKFTTGRSASLFCEGVDLSALGSGKTIVDPTSASAVAATFLRCKLGTSVTLIGASPSPYAIDASFIDCDSAGTNYTFTKVSSLGTQSAETTIVRTGGASDGTTPISQKIVTTANSLWPVPFVSAPIAIWNDTVGSSATATIYGIWGGGSVPNNDDIWIEAEYLGSSGSPQASFVNSGKADGLASNAALSSDASTWGGSTTAFKMSVTFTPQQKGLVYITVKAAKASSTFYIDTKPEISGVTVSKTYVAPGGVINELQSSGGSAAVARAGLHGIEQGIAA